MAQGTLSLVDQVVPKLGDYWWNLMEKEFFREFVKRDPFTFSRICQGAFLSVVMADFSTATGHRIDAMRAYPYKFPPEIQALRGWRSVEESSQGSEVADDQ